MSGARIVGTHAARRSRRRRKWPALDAGSVVALLVAVLVLSGTAQAIVATAAIFSLLLTAARSLDDPDFRSRERMAPSTHTDVYAQNRYRSGMGVTVRPPHQQAGPVNTPEQDRVDELERTWRSSPYGE